MKEKVIKMAITGAPFLGFGMLIGAIAVNIQHQKYVRETNHQWREMYKYTQDMKLELEEEIRRNRILELKVTNFEERQERWEAFKKRINANMNKEEQNHEKKS